MAIKANDFVKVNFDIYANDKLVQTTDEKKGKESKLQIESYGPQTIIIGKSFIFKALDDAIISKDSDSLNLSPENAYGKRDSKLIKTYPESVFTEKKLRAIPGMTYDFNGNYGTVKSASRGRVMVDFNNPLAGKDIKLEYSLVEVVTDIKEKISVVLTSLLRLTPNMFDLTSKEKVVTISIPKELVAMKEMLIKSFEEMISDAKDYTYEFAEKAIPKK